ncbi:hypothetical protein NC651_008053 [Populus alba x Populus x berolinensis]|nr:hypothetical protein NC651_008053 [Populus alba x Populus x berolinensis]
MSSLMSIAPQKAVIAETREEVDADEAKKVPKAAIRLARKAHRKVTENVIMSMSTKSAILALAFSGHPLVWAAVLADHAAFTRDATSCWFENALKH